LDDLTKELKHNLDYWSPYEKGECIQPIILEKIGIEGRQFNFAIQKYAIISRFVVLMLNNGCLNYVEKNDEI